MALRNPFAAISDDIAALRMKQDTLAESSTAARRQQAVMERTVMETGKKRTMVNLELRKAHVEQLQTRLVALQRSGDLSDRVTHERKWLGNEIVKTVAELEGLVTRARAEAENLDPKIRWCLHIEQGHSEVDATNLIMVYQQNIERAARRQAVEAEDVVREVVSISIDANGDEAAR